MDDDIQPIDLNRNQKLAGIITEKRKWVKRPFRLAMVRKHVRALALPKPLCSRLIAIYGIDLRAKTKADVTVGMISLIGLRLLLSSPRLGSRMECES